MNVDRFAGVLLKCFHALPLCMPPSHVILALSSTPLLTCLESSDTVAAMLLERSSAGIRVPNLVLMTGLQRAHVIAEVLGGGH